MAAQKKTKTTRAAPSGAASKPGGLPHQGAIEGAFGVDVNKFDLRTTNAAFKGSRVGTQALDAKTYAEMGSIAFSKSPDLHTAAHEAAHVVQQRSGG